MIKEGRFLNIVPGLYVAGSSATSDEITLMEGGLKTKLQNKEMGLNRNLARTF